MAVEVFGNCPACVAAGSSGTTTTDTSWTMGTGYTSFPVASTSSSPATYFYIRDPADTANEIVQVTSGGGGSSAWTAVRGANGSTAVAHAAGATWVQVIAPGTLGNFLQAAQSPNPWRFLPETYGAKGDLRVLQDAVMASTSSGVLTSATAAFTASDVGKSIIVNVGAAGANQAPLITTIASYQSATQVTLTANPPATAAGNPCAYGTDDSAALQACWAAAQAYMQSSPSGYGEMFLSKVYVMASAPLKGSTSGPNYGYSLLPVTVADTTGSGMKRNIAVTTPSPGDETNYWEQFTGQAAGAGIFAMSAAPGTDGTWGIPSVIGGPTVASWSGGSLTGGFANLRLHLGNLKIVVPYNPGWIGVDARYLACVSGSRYGYQAFAVGVLGGGNGPNLGSSPGGSWNFNGTAIRFCAMNNNDLQDFDSITAEGVADGIWFADHATVRRLAVLSVANTMVFDNASGSGSGAIHGAWFGQVTTGQCATNVILVSGTKASTFPLFITYLDVENSSTPTDVNDPNNILTGLVQWWNLNTSVPKVSGAGRLKIVNNKLVPGLWASPPAVPATTVAVAASALPFRDAWVNVQPNGATITAIAVTTNGTATTITGVTSGWVFVPGGSTVTLTYTVATPTWQWWLS